MKKILFEQVGNTGMVGLFISALVQSITMGSTINENGLVITFGPLFTWFIAYSVLFGLARILFSRSKSNGGYNPAKGEFSSEDERERTIAYKAVSTAYKVIIAFSLLSCFGLFIFGLLITDLMIFKVIALSIVGLLIVCGFTVYTISWIVLDLKGE
ncbi:hypothetical protein [Marinilactibacillus kalidii]|uniref:hypothetical protein n=1 Tax=Marinilactibacillus kalidii TaxID=2820274 RepID=UPI001ABDF2B2|nr:hypothetical protein [Marinilactibacillus kalidii]